MEPYVVMVLGYALWFFVLLFGIAGVRFKAMKAGANPVNFTAMGSELPPLGGRISRAHANMVENFGPLAVIVFAAYATGQTADINGLAYIFLCARIGQSIAHISAGTRKAFGVRGLFFMIQVFIQIYWIISILT